MSRKQSRPFSWQDSAAEVGPEDGVDPKEFHDRRIRSPRSPASRKALQLCQQVMEALQLALGGMADEHLQNLTVVSVEPAPNSGRLLVTVAVPGLADVTDETTVNLILEALAKASGRLRTEVAGEIHRRYAPELVFTISLN